MGRHVLLSLLLLLFLVFDPSGASFAGEHRKLANSNADGNKTAKPDPPLPNKENSDPNPVGAGTKKNEEGSPSTNGNKAPETSAKGFNGSDNSGKTSSLAPVPLPKVKGSNDPQKETNKTASVAGNNDAKGNEEGGAKGNEKADGNGNVKGGGNGKGEEGSKGNGEQSDKGNAEQGDKVNGKDGAAGNGEQGDGGKGKDVGKDSGEQGDGGKGKDAGKDSGDQVDKATGKDGDKVNENEGGGKGNQEEKKGNEGGGNEGKTYSQSTTAETCGDLAKCTDNGGMVGCISKIDPTYVVVLLHNGGSDAIKVKLNEGNVEGIAVGIEKTEKVNITLATSGRAQLTFNAGKGDCALQMGFPKPIGNSLFRLPSYDKILTPVNGAYFLIVAVVVLGGTWGCCKLRKKRRGEVPYQELEMAAPETAAVATNDIESAEGWDQVWDDDWDDDVAVKSPGARHVGSISANGLTSRSSNKDGWEDNWDD
ncbi:hypothetical protein PIB30_117377 [Stylosanthes scabra]|uniref:DUF7356 domain-containing protein n=1 Tax=Stylosanthes scabra TaxID=79078 RepID=A0ABU6QE90_9FABA|nr:hypothetical protein [Stylosanthes scabra]